MLLLLPYISVFSHILRNTFCVRMIFSKFAFMFWCVNVLYVYMCVAYVLDVLCVYPVCVSSVARCMALKYVCLLDCFYTYADVLNRFSERTSLLKHIFSLHERVFFYPCNRQQTHMDEMWCSLYSLALPRFARARHFIWNIGTLCTLFAWCHIPFCSSHIHIFPFVMYPKLTDWKILLT